MESYTCPFCDSVFPLTRDTEGEEKYFLQTPQGIMSNSSQLMGRAVAGGTMQSSISKDLIQLHMLKCPSCEKIIVFTTGIGNQYPGEVTPIYPKSGAKQFPDYIPKQIRSDYEEAYSILHLSPKASATLSRRCMQGMIRDFFEIHKSNLAASIDAVGDKIAPDVKETLDSVRQIGNIGAHMEKDVNLIIDISDGEAEQLLKLIEYLMKNWYVNRHDREQLLADINSINADKQAQRKTKN